MGGQAGGFDGVVVVRVCVTVVVWPSGYAVDQQRAALPGIENFTTLGGRASWTGMLYCRGF